MAESSCLSSMEVAQLVEGSLAATAQVRVQQHLATCDACCRLMAVLLTQREGDEVGTVGGLPAIGETWSERYVIVEAVGQGSSGAVFRAVDRDLGRHVALKIARGPADPTLRERWRREAQAGASLDHPNVAPIYEIGEHDGRPFIVMAWVAGRSLRSWLRQQARPPREVAAVFAQAGAGLTAAHRAGLLHRDFKPDNVMLAEGGGMARIIDFGLAAAQGPPPSGSTRFSAADDALTLEGAVVGTPLYMAPELLAGAEASQASDQYAFCVALYEALTGRPPHTGKSFADLAAARLRPLLPLPRRVPPVLARAVLRGLAIDPLERHPSMDELTGLLAQAAAPPPKGRWPLWLLAAALVTAALVVTATLLREPRRQLVPAASAWALVHRPSLAAAFAALDHPAAPAAWRTVDQELARAAAAYDAAARGAGKRTADCLAAQRQTQDLVRETLMAVDAKDLRRLADVLALVGEPASCLGSATPSALADGRATALRRRVFAAVRQGLGRGDPAQRAELEALLAEVNGMGDPALEAPLAYAIGLLDSRRGHVASAWASLDRALTAAEAAATPLFRLRVYVAMLRLAVVDFDPGAISRGHAIAERAEALLAQQGARPWLTADLAAALARQVFREGDWARSRALEQRALDASLIAWGEHSVVTARLWASQAAVELLSKRWASGARSAHAAAEVLRAEFGSFHPEVIEAERFVVTAECHDDPERCLEGFEALARRCREGGLTQHAGYLRLLLEMLGLLEDPVRARVVIHESLDLAASVTDVPIDLRFGIYGRAGLAALRFGEVDLAARALSEGQALGKPDGSNITLFEDLRRGLSAAREKKR